MSSSSENSYESDGPPDKQSKKRGITKMKSVIRMKNTGKKYPIQWNKKKQPIGVNASKLMSYIGHCTRNRVSIAYATWHEVPQDIKIMIAEQVMKAFELPDTKVNWIIKVASDRFREFKNRLTRLFLYIEDGENRELRTEPPNAYDFIDQNAWNEFVAQRLTPKFQELSEKNRQLAKKNLYPFKGSRKGYAGIEQEIIRDKNLDPSTEISRGELWKAARLDIGGGIRTKRVKDIADKIDRLNEQVSAGELTISGRRDTLSLALGKDDHPGRVTGVGKGVTKKQYWPESHDQTFSRESANSNEVKELQAEVQELRRMIKLLVENQQVNIGPTEKDPTNEVLVEDALTQEISNKEVPAKAVPAKAVPAKVVPAKVVPAKEVPAKEVPAMVVPAKEVPANEVPANVVPAKVVPIKDASAAKQTYLVQGSNTSISQCQPPAMVNVEGTWMKCQLFWPNLKIRVATGSMFISSSNAPIYLHCKPLPAKCVKVIIETAMLESSPLPCPIGEASTVKDALGIPLAWPKSHILPLKTSVPSRNLKSSATDISKHDVCQPQLVDRPQIQPTFRSLRKMEKLLPVMDSDRVLASIPMPKTILGYDHNVSIAKSDIERWLLKKRIDSCHVSVYIKYLFENKCPKNLDMFGFLCPQWTSASSESGLTRKERDSYISTSMVQEQSHRKLFFAPYNANGHWMLAVIYPRENTVYWFDPLHDNVKEEFKEVIETAIMMFYADTKENKVRKNTQWLLVECPRQPNTIDCGYYILRYMREIIGQRTLSIPTKYFTRSSDPYTSNQLDEIREEWVEFAEKYIEW